MGFPILSLAALTILEARPREAIEIAARCGYTHVGLRPIAATATEPQPSMLDDRSEQADIAAALAGEGIAVLDLEIARLTPEMDWSRLDQMIDFGARLGCSRLLVADNDPDPGRSAASLARLAELGADRGVAPCLEFMPWTYAPNLAAARERIAGIENAALLVDAFHLARSGGVPDDIALNDPNVSYIQLCDIARPIPSMEEILREARSDRLFPGEGDIDLARLLMQLPGRPISLEVPVAGQEPAARAARAIEATRTLLAAIEPHH